MRHIGFHFSAAGGPEKALERAGDLNVDTVQIFLKNNNRWQGPPVKEQQIADFKYLREKQGPYRLFAHAGYLINPAGDGEVLEKSRRSLGDELHRASLLEIPYLVLHPGSHRDLGRTEGIKRIIETLDGTFEADSGDTVILLETTAGQGTSIGHRFEDLEEIMAASRFPQRLAVCLDTCHIFAAGYDLVDPEGYEKTIEQFSRFIGLEKLKLIHLNDSKRQKESRVDRHEHIGEGLIGDKGFKNLLNDRRLEDVPLVLETPKPDANSDQRNLERVLSLIDRK